MRIVIHLSIDMLGGSRDTVSGSTGSRVLVKPSGSATAPISSSDGGTMTWLVGLRAVPPIWTHLAPIASAPLLSS